MPAYPFTTINPFDSPNVGRSKLNYNFDLINFISTAGTPSSTVILSAGTGTDTTSYVPNSATTYFSVNLNSNYLQNFFTGLTLNVNALKATNSISATTYYSGSTPLSSIINNLSLSNSTNVQTGSNITTGGTANKPIINLIDSPSINNLIVSGTSTNNNLSATTISGGTIFSGNTNLYSIFQQIGQINPTTNISNGLNTYTGGTNSNPTINISAATLNYLSATTLSASTYYSGSTNLSTIIQNIASQYSGNTSSGGFSGWTASTGTNSIIANNGSGNLASGNYSIVGGRANSATTNYSIIGGGKLNLTSNYYSSILGGKKNKSSGYYSVVGGGSFNSSSGNWSVISGGFGNNVTNVYSSILGGSSNFVSGTFSSVVGGDRNSATTNHFIFIGGGQQNLANGDSTFIGGGVYNRAIGYRSSVVGGHLNQSNGQFSIVGGGFQNIVSNSNSSILGGNNNNNLSPYSTILNGSQNILTSTAINSAIVGISNITGTSANTIYIGGLNSYGIGVNFTGATNSDVLTFDGTNWIPSSITTSNAVSTFIQNGLNTYTGGTTSFPTINISAATLNDLTVSGSSNLSTIISGSTNLYNIFTQGSGTTGKLSKWSGPTTLTDSMITEFGTGVTITGGLQVYGNLDILGTATTFNTTTVQATDNIITLNFSGNHLTALDGGIIVLSGQPNGGSSTWTIDINGNWSANTGIYTTALTVNNGNISSTGTGQITSGGTDLYTIFQKSNSSILSVGQGSNITTGGTSLNPIINLVSSPSVNNLTTSGTSLNNNLSATTLSAGTLYSGSTNLYQIFQKIGQVNPSTNISNGLNTYTGGTTSSPSVNISAATLNNLIVSGNSNFNILSATTINATTYYGIIDKIGVSVDGQGGVLSTGITSFSIMNSSGHIVGWDIVAYPSGSCVFDIWKSNSGTTLPTISNSIVGVNYPTLTNNFYSGSTNLTGWNINFSQGDIITYNINSVTGITKAILNLKIIKN